MNAQELFLVLEGMTPEEREGLDLFIQQGRSGSGLNMETADQVALSTYFFFGKPVPCLMIRNERLLKWNPEGYPVFVKDE
jgi:hypothetical protein